MDARSSLRWIFSILFILAIFGPTVLAGPTVIYGDDFDLQILDRQDWGSPLTEAIIEVPDHFIINDLDVGINLTHTNVFDLQIFVQSPDQTRLCLNMYDFKDEFFKGADYLQTIFDDEAVVPIEQGAAPFTGRFKPKAGNVLSLFDEQDAYGIWRLQIYDMWYWDTGRLEHVDLIFSISEPAITIPEPAAVSLLMLGVSLIALFRRHST